MKKTISFLSLLFGLFMCVTVFSACGDDDESFGGNESSHQTSKHIVKTIEEDGSSIYETTFLYDSQGRIVKVDEIRTSSRTNDHSVLTYQYGELAINSNEVRETSYSNGQIFTWSESHTYTLRNGLIVKDVEVQSSNGGHPSSTTTTYTYDNNGYMATSSVNGYTNNFTWTNGNLTCMGEREFTYTNISWPKGMFFHFKGSNLDSLLWPGGFWGKTPKNMPHQDLYKEWTYDYTITNGLITKMRLIESGSVEYVATYTWK